MENFNSILNDKAKLTAAVNALDFKVEVKGAHIHFVGAVNAAGLVFITGDILGSFVSAIKRGTGCDDLEAKAQLGSALMMYIEDELGLDPKKMLT